VTTIRTTRLVRAPSLHAFQDAIIQLGLERGVSASRHTAIIVPTRSAARQLRRTFEDAMLAAERRAIVLPDLVTRTEYYERLRADLDVPVGLLTPYEREAILLAGAHEAVTEGLSPPFELRPALIGEMLELYDQLRRQRQSIDDFDRLLTEELEPRALTDRGAERMLRQTVFLAAAFRFYERRVDETGSLDEHGLRARVLAATSSPRYTHVVVTVGEHATDPGGLWPVDFDLLTRLHGLERLTVVSTEAQLAAGWLERVSDLLPGIESVRAADRDEPLDDRVLLVPAEREPLYFSSRDREDEVADVVRRIKSLRRGGALTGPLHRTGVVFARPLPYLYLARTTLASAGVPYQCDDALPLAGEPVAAALDLVLDVISSGASRSALVALLRSPHFALGPERTAVSPDAVRALDETLISARYTGDVTYLAALAEEWATESAGTADQRQAAVRRVALPACLAALNALAHLQPLFEPHPASVHLDCLRAFFEHLGIPPGGDETVNEREWRAQKAVLATIQELADAHRRHGDLAWSSHELGGTLRRWLEAQTFTPRTGTTGVQFLDASAARYARLDDVNLVGLVEGEWPERGRRNLFYAPFLLKGLGWIEDRSRVSAWRAAFLDLLLLARRTTAVSTFLLEEDSLVEPSSLLEDLPRAQLTARPVDRDPTPVFADEAVLAGSAAGTCAGPEAEQWLGLRLARSSHALPIFHGTGLPHRPPVHSVSALELYVQCPFKYFARYVLKLREEVESDEALGPRERGSFVHAVFQSFYERWERENGGAITPGTIERAHALFETVLEEHLARLTPSMAALERTRLLGSPVAPGLADLVFSVEAIRDTPIVARRLEDRFDGSFELEGPNGPRLIAIRGAVDRIDMLGDGSLRIIDYKSSAPQKPVQLAIYAVTAEQRLRGLRGREWRAGEVAYLIFGAPRGLKPLVRRPADLPAALVDAQFRVLAAVDAIEAGQFPPRPVYTHLCASCAYEGVCRKDYVSAPDQSDVPAAV
jgi:RecB family exonuclease